MHPRTRFLEASERAFDALRAGELLLCTFSGERSDFVRFNHGRVRQAGTVEQGYLTVRLVRERKQASLTLALPGDVEGALATLRQIVGTLPDDPWLLVNRTPQSSDTVRRGALAPAQTVVAEVVAAAGGADLVGFYAAGALYRGFANSLGQRNWHEVDSFSFDWSVYARVDKAVKASYAGFDWDGSTFETLFAQSARQAEKLAIGERTLPPGEYRAYLAPRALEELMSLLCWGGFSARARQTRQSPLLRMQQGAVLSPLVSLAENTAEGLAPGFQADGFRKPGSVSLIAGGALGEPLVSPRSAVEYGLEANGAGAQESPDSQDLAPGTLEEAEVLHLLDTGLYVPNLWYLNYSDRAAGRITGMTRFATFWVEKGRIVAPVAPLRFDDTIYRMLGTKLLGLGRQREVLLDSSTYGERSTASMRLPGALLSALRFTL